MVVGSGLVAKGFSAYKNDDKYLVFASGVSNSANTNETAFQREKSLLAASLKDNADKTFIYFSTCSIYDKSLGSTAYVKHKLAMEKLVRETHPHYYIFRVSNLAGNTDNPHTVLNFFVQHIKEGKPFQIWKNASRNIIDIDDAVLLCDYIVKQNKSENSVVNIANPHNYSVSFIVKEIEAVLQQKGDYAEIDKTSEPAIDTTIINPVIATLNIAFDDGYLQRTLKKYYSAS